MLHHYNSLSNKMDNFLLAVRDINPKYIVAERKMVCFNMDNENTFAFLCDTPLKVFNAINFVSNNVMGSQNKSDIFIYDHFNDAAKVSKNIMQSKIFNNVYLIQSFDTKKNWKSKFITSIHIFFPKYTLKKYSINKLSFDRKYTYLCLSCPTTFTICVTLAYEHKWIIGMEDGLSSYIGNIFNDKSSKILLIFNRLFLKNRLIENIDYLYLNNTSYNLCAIQCSICQLPLLTSSNRSLELSMKIFDYISSNLYSTYPVIYLSQPLNEIANFKPEQENEILNHLQRLFPKRVIVRVHPRQNPKDFSDYTLDNVNNLWELECIQQISNNSVLIGGYSTAQFYSKMLFNREPYIIFLYKVFYEDTGTQYWNEVEHMISTLKYSYSDNDKIFIPKDFDEFDSIMYKIHEVIA
ncbi:hypothetical protein DW886_22375 [Enterocloster aldenensis]|nr:hypothetical protein DW886_22375 [Enterocloster aldenensis]